MEYSPSWEVNRFSASQEIPHIRWNPKVYYRILKSPPPALLQSQINPVHAFLHPTSWRYVLILSSHLRTQIHRVFNNTEFGYKPVGYFKWQEEGENKIPVLQQNTWYYQN